MPEWDVLSISHSFVAIPQSIRKCSIEIQLPAKLQLYKEVRETQTLDFVPEILKFNVVMTISHAKVNPTVLSYTHENRVKLQSPTYN